MRKLKRKKTGHLNSKPREADEKDESVGGKMNKAD